MSDLIEKVHVTLAKKDKRIAELEAEQDRLLKMAERLAVLAAKWVDAKHHDWPEIKELMVALEAGK